MPLNDPIILPLWPAETPAATGGDPTGEIAYLANGLKVIRNVTQPTLTAYLPDPARATGAAIIVCPGGAYHFLAFEHEGIEVARWLNERGIAAFLLKYRLYPTGDDFPECVDQNLATPERIQQVLEVSFPQITADGLQAIRMVREHAAEWGVHPQRVGIMGFSAGGAATLCAALHYDAASRPDFAAPIYPAPPAETPIPADAPPLFLLCAADDDMASDCVTKYYTLWRAAGRPVESHIYAQGGHGFGMTPQGTPSDHWIERLGEWLEALPKA